MPDAQVCDQRARKDFGEPARVEVNVEEMVAGVQTAAEGAR